MYTTLKPIQRRNSVTIKKTTPKPKYIKPTPKPQAPTPKPQAPKYIAKISRLFNPHQSIYITTTDPVELKLDSWTECQLEAGLLIKC